MKDKTNFSLFEKFAGQLINNDCKEQKTYYEF